MDSVGFCCWTRKRIASNCWKIMHDKMQSWWGGKKQKNHVCDRDEVKHEQHQRDKYWSPQSIVTIYNYMRMELTMYIKWRKMEQHTTLKWSVRQQLIRKEVIVSTFKCHE